MSSKNKRAPSPSSSTSSTSTEHLIVDITEILPGRGIQHNLADMSLQSNSSTSSSNIARRSQAADNLNRTLLFGESERPDDLTADWCYVSDKNAQKRVEHATSDLDTFIHLLKGNVGIGLLSIPLATKNAGYIAGTIGILVIGVIAMHCMTMLVDCASKLCEWNNIPALDYSETMQFALKERGASSRVSRAGKIVVNVFLVITQFGFCSVYFVFIGETLKLLLDQAYCLNVSKEAWIAAVILPVMIFCWIRNLDNLAPLSIIANVAIFLGLVFIFYDEFFRLTTSDDEYKAPFRLGDISFNNSGNTSFSSETQLHSFGTIIGTSLFFGNVVYSFEGIGVILPLENKMKTPQHAKRVIYVGMILIVLLYTFFGLIGYLSYGETIQASVTLNLCGRSAATTIMFLIVQLLFILNTFVSYLLQFYVPMDFLEPPLYKKLKLDYLTYKFPKYHNIIKTAVQLGFRSGLVLITAVLALSIPNLDDLITLVGAVASSGLAMIFPPLIHSLTYWKTKTRVPKVVWFPKDVIIMVVGSLGFLFGTFAAFHSIVKDFQHKPDEITCAPSFQSSCAVVD